jgi:hypothetical protein
MKRIHLLLLLPLLLVLMAFRQTPLVDPPPISVPAGMSDATVTNAIAESLMARHWTIVKRLPGELDATYAPRDFSVTIAVHYDARQVQINYVTSENLKYKVRHGRPYIHTSYDRWVRNLATDIHNEVMVGTQEAGGVD